MESETFILNGEKMPISVFLKRKPETKHENDVLLFMKEWHALNEYIEVQTSGSTGTPKKIKLAKNFIEASARRTLQYFDLKPGDRILHCLPCQYIAGKLMVVRALVGHLDLCTEDPSTDFEFLKKEKFRFAAMVANQAASIPDGLIPQIEQLLIGGSNIPASLQRRMENISSAIYSSYAMTETATHIAIRQIKDDWYHCMKDISVNLSDEGCLRIMMPGLNQAFLQTTDIAEVKGNKIFRILGRADNAIISGGIKYHPEQMEKKLEKHITLPFMITSLPHNDLGEQIVLVIEGDSNTKIADICSRNLSKYERPRQIIYLEKLPRTPNGKIARKLPTQFYSSTIWHPSPQGGMLPPE